MRHVTDNLAMVETGVLWSAGPGRTGGLDICLTQRLLPLGHSLKGLIDEQVSGNTGKEVRSIIMNLANRKAKQCDERCKRRRGKGWKTQRVLVKIRWLSGPLRLAFHMGMWYYKVIFYGGQAPDRHTSGRNHNE